MSATVANPVKRSRWLDWTPKTSILAELPKSEPSKPSKTGFDGFVGLTSADSPKIQPEPDGAELPRPPKSASQDRSPKTSILADLPECEPSKPSKPGFDGFVGVTSADSHKIEPKPDGAELARASAVIREAGVRIMQLDGVTTIGIWSDRDGLKLRIALSAFGSNGVPIRYLDGAGIPMRYKLRRVEGEPVPLTVLAEMERSPREPWKVRDRMLHDMGWDSGACSWPEWKAVQLNRLFQQQGVTRRPGRITAETVRHGEISRGRKHCGSMSDGLAHSEERHALALVPKVEV